MSWDQLTIPELAVWITFFWSLCGIPGAIVGNIKNAGKQGLLLGTLLGPVGVVLAFTLDRRPKCQSCLRPIESHELWIDEGCETTTHVICQDCRAAAIDKASACSDGTPPFIEPEPNSSKSLFSS